MKNFIFLAFLVLFCDTGCADGWWTPDTLPADVIIVDEQLEPVLETVIDAMDGYNVLFTKDIFNIKIDYGRKHFPCGKIYLMVGHNKGGEAIAKDECKLFVYIDPKVLNQGDGLRLTVQHEMGHSIGLMHVDDEKSVMYPSNIGWDPKTGTYDQHITQENIDHIVAKYHVVQKK